MELKLEISKDVYEEDIHKMLGDLEPGRKEEIIKEAFKEWFASDNFRLKSTGSYSTQKELTSKGELVEDIVKALRKDVHQYYEEVVLADKEVSAARDAMNKYLKHNASTIMRSAISSAISEKIFIDRDSLKYEIMNEIGSNRY